MRRKDREVTDINVIENIIKKAVCCRLGFNDNGEVYIVPLNFGYKKEDNKFVFYFHSACKGRKIDIIKTEPYAGFELDCECKITEGETPCSYSAKYESIIGNGHISIVEKTEEKKEGLKLIMKHYTGRENWEFKDEMVEKVCVFKLAAHKMSCKVH